MTESDHLYRVVRPIDGHPVPLEQEKIDEIWNSARDPALSDEPPSVDEVHEEYVETLAEYGPWKAIQARYPFSSRGVVLWNCENGEALSVDQAEGEWHTFVNFLAAIVDEEGDCRDADYSGGMMPSGAQNQRCEECGSSWSVG